MSHYTHGLLINFVTNIFDTAMVLDVRQNFHPGPYYGLLHNGFTANTGHRHIIDLLILEYMSVH